MMNSQNQYGLKKIKLEDYEHWKNELDQSIQLEDFESIFIKMCEEERLGTTYSFWFSSNDKRIGFVQVFGIMKHAFYSGYIEISIFEKFRNQGFGKKAIKSLEEFSFNELGLKKLIAPILPDNSASIGLFSSLGYEKVGTDPYAFFLDGKAVAHEIYVTLNNL